MPPQSLPAIPVDSDGRASVRVVELAAVKTEADYFQCAANYETLVQTIKPYVVTIVPDDPPPIPIEEAPESKNNLCF